MQQPTWNVVIESGAKRVFASALEWPGWSRAGSSEEGALEALLAYGPRYAAVLAASGIEFALPKERSQLRVVERSDGVAATDFGVPAQPAEYENQPLKPDELRLRLKILRACWAALDQAVVAAAGRQLQRGPRGGGRDTDAIVEHVHSALHGYLGRLLWKRVERDDQPLDLALAGRRDEALAALKAASQPDAPTSGPRGGTLWTASYFMRREAWHVLDHVWEIEDRIITES